MTPPSAIYLPELLAPAGSPASLKAAIAAGADAVYLSGKRFGARKSAANFTDDEIRESIRLAHSRGVRVYVTVNTLIHDRELKGVADYLLFLYAAGADAVLVQDAGVASLVREIVPGLTIHASTQMTVHNTEGLLRAAEQGFSRVVLPRELGLAEINAMAEKTRSTGIGLEVFIHGALCYSYSGQCLLSSVIGGRSGNRGTCAQPCRKPYSLVTGELDRYGRAVRLRDLATNGKYLLSPRDLCTYRHLRELVKAPVVSLKIEGRMRSPEYVAVVVSTYRRALNEIAAGEWKPDPAAERDLLLAFNRGFTAGYLFGEKHKALMARDAPDNRGVMLGVVKSQDAASGAVIIQPCGDLIPATGDGLFFADPARTAEDWGFSLNNVPLVRGGTITLRVPRHVGPGTLVWITSSRELETRAGQIITHPPADLVRSVPVDLAVAVSAEGRVTFSGSVEGGGGKVVPVMYSPAFSLVPARTHPVTADEMEARLRKSGDSQFILRTLALDYNGAMFAPVAELNRMRREFLTLAEDALVASFLPPAGAVEQARQKLEEVTGADSATLPEAAEKKPPTITLTVCADTPESVSAAVRAGCDRICFEVAFPSASHRCEGEKGQGVIASQVLPLLDLCRDAGVAFVLQVPRISRDAYLETILPEIPGLCRSGLSGCMTDDAGTARAVRACEPELAVAGGQGLNIFNHRAACSLVSLFSSLTLSAELSGTECGELVRLARSHGCQVPFSLVVQGSAEAMITEDCLLEPLRQCRKAGHGDSRSSFFGIRDTTGHIFPVRVDGECRTRIGNAVETSLLDHLPVIARAGINDVVIDARGRTEPYAGEMTRIYREGLAHVMAGTHIPASLKEQVRARALGGITAGHFLRGLKE